MTACEQLGGKASVGSILHHIDAQPVSEPNHRLADRYSSSQLYRHWKASSSANQFLWFRGPPGSGKTTKVIQIVEELNNYNTSLSDHQDVVYFLCSKEATSSASAMLRSVIAQLILRYPVRVADSGCDKDVLLNVLNPATHTTFSILWKFLIQFLRTGPHRTTHWLIDGLDALPVDELESFVQELRSLWDAWNNDVRPKDIWLKILVTSHPYAAIFRKSFTDIPHVAPDEEVLGLLIIQGYMHYN